jgi:hypothetical protein
VITVAPVLIGTVMGVADYLEFKEGLASVSWLEAKGKILSNSVRSERVNNRMIYIPTVVYSYHIGDDAYRGHRISYPDGLPATEKKLRKLLESVAVEHPITAYYDPKHTSSVTLVRGIRRSKYVLLFLRDAAVVLLLPLILLGRWIRQLTKKRRA